MSNLRYGIHLLRKYANLPEIPSRLKSMDQRHHSRQGREQRKESRSKISKYQVSSLKNSYKFKNRARDRGGIDLWEIIDGESGKSIKWSLAAYRFGQSTLPKNSDVFIFNKLMSVFKFSIPFISREWEACPSEEES